MKATLDTIKAKQEQAAALTAAFNNSLHIQTIWPDAFHNGQSCTLKTVVSMAPYPSRDYQVKRAALVRSDGVEYEITLEQYRTLSGGSFDLSKGFKRIVTD